MWELQTARLATVIHMTVKNLTLYFKHNLHTITTIFSNNEIPNSLQSTSQTHQESDPYHLKSICQRRLVQTQSPIMNKMTITQKHIP